MIIHSIFLLLVAIAVSAIAEPEVIADFGGKATGLHSPRDRLQAYAKGQPTPRLLARDPNAGRFPLRSTMQPGVVDRHVHDKPVNRPFFIVSVDQHSAKWLQANHTYLQDINARGLATNVNSEQELDILREYLGDIPLDAIPVDSIADVFGLSYYPVLVTQEEITQ